MESVPTKLAGIYSVSSGERRSFAATMRMRRFKIVNNIIENIIKNNGTCSILDVGGSEYYWDLNSDFIEKNSTTLTITISNIVGVEVKSPVSRVFKAISGDATKRELYDGAYDFIHSNSVIEHVGGWKSVCAMASNIVETALPFYVQTPNYWFPFEPHFRTLGFQYLPAATRAKMLLKKRRGFYVATSYEDAMAEIESINLLTFEQMRHLFPGAKILRERLWPFTKSLMAVRGLREAHRVFTRG